MRTRTSTIQFKSPFHLPGSPRPHPPGVYRVITADEEVRGLSFVAWRTVKAHLQVPALGSPAQHFDHVPVTIEDLEACVCHDRIMADA